MEALLDTPFDEDDAGVPNKELPPSFLLAPPPPLLLLESFLEVEATGVLAILLFCFLGAVEEVTELLDSLFLLAEAFDEEVFLPLFTVSSSSSSSSSSKETSLSLSSRKSPSSYSSSLSVSLRASS
jgi:hypothetical protein